MKPYRIDIEDEGRAVVLIVEAGGATVTLRGSPASMRKVRDELTQAIVIAEVWATRGDGLSSENDIEAT